MSDEPKPVNQTLRAFSQFITQVEDGHLHADLSRALQDLIADMQTASGGHDKTAGKIKIALDLKYDPKSGVFEIAGNFDVTKPKERRGHSVLWATPDNFLTPLNPRQQDLFIRDVSAGSSTEIRSV